MKLLHSALVIAFVVLTLLSPASAGAYDSTSQKIFGRWTSPASALMGYHYTGSLNVPNQISSTIVSCTEKWIAIGAPLANENGGTKRGAVQVFNTVTGAWLRRIDSPLTTDNSYFGHACAVFGNTLAVTALRTQAVYIYDLTTGKLTKTLTPTNGASSSGFGISIAMDGNRVVVGDTGFSGGPAPGRVIVFDLKTGAQLHLLTPIDSALIDNFGFSLAVEGRMAIIGAPNGNGGIGTAYGYDLESGGAVYVIRPAGGMVGDQIGYSVALHRGLAIIGAPGAGGGSGALHTHYMPTGVRGFSAGTLGSALGHNVAIHQGLVIANLRGSFATRSHVELFDPAPGAAFGSIGSLTTYDNTTIDGSSLALCNGTAVITSEFDSSQGLYTGAAFIFRGLVRPIGMKKVAARGDYAAPFVDTSYNFIRNPSVNTQGYLSFATSLAGSGSHGGKDTGIWYGYAGSLGLVVGSPAYPLSTVTDPVFNSTSTLLFSAKLTNLAKGADKIIFKSVSSVDTPLLQTGIAYAAINGGRVSSFGPLVQSGDPTINGFAFAAPLVREAGFTTAANDSAVVAYNVASDTIEGMREGRSAGTTGSTYGQFTGRVAFEGNTITYSAAIGGTTTANQAIFNKTLGNPETRILRKGDPVTDTGGTTRAGIFFSTLLAECTQGDTLIRATIRGTGVNTANNEGLWRYRSGTLRQVLLKGSALPGLPTLRPARIIRFWQTGNDTVAQVKLAGTGVSSANDQAIILLSASDMGAFEDTRVLMREGDPASGCDTATIGTISQVEFNSGSGQFLAAVTLAKASKGTELCLLRGNNQRIFAAGGYRLVTGPTLVLRKGQLYTNQPGKLKSFVLPKTSVSASGAGNSGLPTFFQPAAMALNLEFENGVRVLMSGVE